ncbi:MAG: bifunctional folylpolyglutamate synthase/dihydrofolate synthase [Lachnospiraceae bacterium]|nr:bifunctional folylpolyglutamate synthase/dihydrofolate synthase [Lachnospiraceae bacterium]
MTEKEFREYQEGLLKLGRVPGLEATRELCRRVGDPQKDLRFIHVAGTNGKGSVCAYLESVLLAAGFPVGRYSSPTITDYRERFLCKGKMIARSLLYELTEQVKEAAEGMEKEGLSHPTAFECETVVGFLFWKKKKCDPVILECGMGGLLDATNVIPPPLLTILTSIGMDHEAFLGDTIEQITSQKCGIIKEGSLVVSAKQDPSAEKVIRDTCRKKNVKLTVCDPDRISDIRYGLQKQSFRLEKKRYEIRLAGICQIENAHLALEAVKTLQSLGLQWQRLTDEAVSEGLKNTRWPGRFQVIAGRPMMVLDGAHNPPAAQKLAASLQQYFTGKRLVFAMGVFRDKDVDGIMQATAHLAAQIVTFRLPDTERSLDALSLAQKAAEYNPNVTSADSLKEAVELGRLLAGEDGVLVIFGSLSMIGELLGNIEVYNRKQKSRNRG